ncbi:MAG: MOSC domain-containing protein [Candidatus Latescibacteria bacterium]|nr:MOSC domain-containing protein [Candidatus Latescibacterota bacterium]
MKSFGGEKLDRVAFDEKGLLGDRAYALVDKETGKVVSAKSVKLFPELLNCSAVYVDSPEMNQEIPPVQITLSDGTSVASDSEDVDQVLSGFFGKDVTLARAAPDDYTIDQYHPDVENLDPTGHRDISVEQKLGSALFKEMGVDSPLPPGSFMDVFPISVMTTSTLDHLQALRPESNFDVSRFRMNVIVKTSDPGFVENSWVGSTVTIGNNVQLIVTMPDPRCVMVTLSQSGIPQDTQVLRTLVAHNRLDIMGSGQFPCAGVYAVVVAGGSVGMNDTVVLG